MKTVDIRDIAANIDKLVEQAEKGKPFTISVNGKPLVKVSRISKEVLDQLPAPEDDSTREECLAPDLSAGSNNRMRVRHAGAWGSWHAVKS